MIYEPKLSLSEFKLDIILPNKAAVAMDSPRFRKLSRGQLPAESIGLGIARDTCLFLSFSNSLVYGYQGLWRGIVIVLRACRRGGT